MSVQSTTGKTIAVSAWRTPLVIITCGCLIARSASGRALRSACFSRRCRQTYSWGRDVFALALAIQNLIWGAADSVRRRDRRSLRYADRVLSVGAVLYALGLVLMAHSTTPGMLNLSAGVLIGLGIVRHSFTLVLARSAS